jgi:hypothetical protein
MNRGQTDSRVKFLARGTGYTLFLTPSEAVWSLTGRITDPGALPATKAIGHATDSDAAATLRMALVGGNTDSVVEGLAPLPGRVN